MKVAEHKLSEPTGKKYGIRVRYVDDSTIVDYIHDAVNFTPINQTQPDEYNWNDVWFVKDNKPVVLSYNCRNMNPIENMLPDILSRYELHGNIMSMIPKVYISLSCDKDSETIIISDTKHDDSYVAIAHIDKDGIEKDFLFLSVYQTSLDNKNMFRSISNKKIFKTPSSDIDLKAFTILTGDNNRWNFIHWNSHVLIRYLLMILYKTDNISSIIGKCVDERHNTYTSMNKPVQFKTVDNRSKHNYVFYIEDFLSNDIIHFEGISEKDMKFYIDSQLVFEFNNFTTGRASRFISTYHGRFPIMHTIDEDRDDGNLIAFINFDTKMVRFIESDSTGQPLSKLSLLNFKTTKETYFLQHL